jgi:DNA repair photolyase
LTRGILETLAPHQPRLLIQTRGPLVVRDLDVLAQFDSVRVNFSITTDSERVRQAFEPKAPPLDRRWAAAQEVRAAGISVGLCLTPLLPLDDPERFIDRVCEFPADVLVLQDFHESHGGFGADTGDEARRLLAESGWSPTNYERVLTRFRERLDQIYEGEAGFFPPDGRSEVALPALST